ncbi:MAG: YfhO family protein [Butyrivibrio sp.]|nr:YfhO family protein [Butyrivibrio sp.]
MYLGRWIRNALSGDFHLYDTSISLGESVIGVLNYYGFGDILLTPFALFPERYIHYGYTLSIISRLYLAGAMFLLYMDFKGYRTIYSIIGALFYIFSPYTFVEGMLFHCYLTVVFVWLPLIMTGVEKVLKTSQPENTKK